MGVACPHLSDEPSYTMVESSGGSCRCACQDDFQDPLEQPSGCCSPHVFTSILLGILSCVLMTGGVFLAFHRWDPMWLMVSGVGVVLIIIGTILHCCNNLSQRPKRHTSAGKGCCSRPIPPDHNGHMIANNGSLTEQLLPLSNARSVSQLSLNMLPGYFPPVVTAYGIEQHSAVVQNINRLVQQQQQQQQQQHQPPQSPGSISQGVASNAGKSFIVLSLPGDASAANIQNLVATVYQLDGNTTESTPNDAPPNVTPNIVSVVKPNSAIPLILKNAEVQTCNVWPVPVVSTSGINSTAACSSSIETSLLQATPAQPIATFATCGSTQTDDVLPISEITDLIDCSTNVSPPICDNPSNVCDNQSMENSALANIPPQASASSSSELLDVSLTTTNTAVSTAECLGSVLVDIPDLTAENPVDPSTTVVTTTTVSNNNHHVDAVASPVSNLPSSDCPEVLIDISENSSGDINSNTISPLLERLAVNSNSVQQVSETARESAVASDSLELPRDTPPENTNSNPNPDVLSNASNFSADDTELDDGELMDRSSPPPSYEDVTLEGENVGAFGLAYGTI